MSFLDRLLRRSRPLDPERIRQDDEMRDLTVKSDATIERVERIVQAENDRLAAAARAAAAGLQRGDRRRAPR